LLVAQHDALDDPSPLSVQSRGDRSPQPATQPVGDAAEPAPMAYDPPPVSVEDYMDAVAPEPGAFVEAVLCRPRTPYRHDRLEHGALRRRPARRKLEQDGLAEREPSEAAHLRRDAQLEPGTASRAGDNQERPLRRVRALEQDAAVERL
jgi:hypothetical protein